MSQVKHAPVSELSLERRMLVADNLGLVAVHLRHHVPGGRQAMREREYDDLFQEGCLGLIQAAQRFDPRRGIPFASFALPRIRHAISLALGERFSLVRVPPARKPRKRRGQGDDGGTDTVRRDAKRNNEDGGDIRADEGQTARRRSKGPRVVELDPHVGATLAERRHSPLAPPADSIGARLREKHQRATQQAVEQVAAGGRNVSRQMALLQRLRDERQLIPREEFRTPMRQLAREMSVSFAHAARCERRLDEQTQAILARDPQFAVLHAAAAESDDGMDSPVEEPLASRLAQATAESVARRLESADPRERLALLDRLIGLLPEGCHRDAAVQALVACVPTDQQEALAEIASGAPDTDRSPETP